MKIRQLLIAVTVSLLLAANIAMAEKGKGESGGNNRGHHGSFPEISVSSGVSAIALLTGVLLLVGERARTKRP
jgi:hypothetical protein